MPIKVAKELIDTQWSGFAPGSATRALPAILLPLAIAVATNRPVAGAIIAAGAMPLGVAYVLRPPLRASAMAFASLGMALSALVGTLAGHSKIAIILVAAAWTFWCRLLWALGPNTSWIGQQCVLNVLVASGFSWHSTGRSHPCCVNLWRRDVAGSDRDNFAAAQTISGARGSRSPNADE